MFPGARLYLSTVVNTSGGNPDPVEVSGELLGDVGLPPGG